YVVASGPGLLLANMQINLCVAGLCDDDMKCNVVATRGGNRSWHITRPGCAAFPHNSLLGSEHKYSANNLFSKHNS
ncbi:MAG: hypothetical protein ACRD3T_22210, partial [Terriglobia bacterium]